MISRTHGLQNRADLEAVKLSESQLIKERKKENSTLTPSGLERKQQLPEIRILVQNHMTMVEIKTGYKLSHLH